MCIEMAHYFVMSFAGFKILFIFIAFVVCFSKSTEQNNIVEFQQYFDIASVPKSQTITSKHSSYVVCMLNSWAYWRQGEGKFDIEKHFDGSLCTHLVYRSILLNREALGIKYQDYDLDIKLGYFNKVVRMKTKYPGLKILLSVGGFGDGIKDNFARMAAAGKNRKSFIQNATETIKSFGFDGLNLDWEFPEQSSKNQFTNLAEEFKQEFKRSKLILTTTISGNLEQTRYIYDVPKICRIFDLVLIMGFDYSGSWQGHSGHNAPLYDAISVSKILEYLSEAKVDPQVLVLGVPLDGKSFHLQMQNKALSGLNSRTKDGFPGPLTSDDEMWGYNEVCQLLKSEDGRKNWKTYWDRSDLVPFTTNGSHLISFDNPDSIFAKVWMAKEYKLKGIMAWSIDTDDFNGRCTKVNYPLLRTINYALQMKKDPRSRLPSLCTLYESTGNLLRPIITDTNKNITNTHHNPPKTSKIRCSAKGNPRPRIRWFKSNKGSKDVEVFNTNHEGTQNSGNHPGFVSPAQINCGPHKPLEDTQEAKFVFDKSRMGNYFCVADNFFGEDRKNFSLQFGDTKTTKGGRGIPWVWIAVGSSLFAVILVNVGVIAYCWKKRALNKKEEGLTKQELRVFFRGSTNKRRGSNNVYEEKQAAIENTPYDSSYEILKDFEIDESKILGDGVFGIVFMGKVNGEAVAVKSTKDGADKQYLVALLSELKILIYIGKHPNIVNLVGASTIHLNKGMLYIFVEYCPLGNLQNYLKNNCRGGPFISLIKDDQWDQSISPQNMTENMITSKDLLHWCHQIAKALEYLASKKVIHGDLASRNVLLLQKNVIKVTDFGLSRKLYDYSNYVKNKQEPLPWRWMAIEALKDLSFSHKSDVWAFGITVWEIFSLGETPYSGISWTTNFVDRLKDGLRIHKPKYATTSLYHFLAKCWEENPQDRHDPGDLSQYFSNLLDEKFSKDYTTLTIPEPDNLNPLI